MKKPSERQTRMVKAYLTPPEHSDFQKRMEQELITAEATYVRRLILKDIQDNLCK